MGLLHLTLCKSINLGNGYRLEATAAGLATATSIAFNIIELSSLRFSLQPRNTLVGNSISPPVRVQVLDNNGDLADVSNQITMSLGNDPGGTGVLSGTVTVSPGRGDSHVFKP